MEALILTAKCENGRYKITALCPKCGVINNHGSDTKGKYWRGCKGHEYFITIK